MEILRFLLVKLIRAEIGENETYIPIGVPQIKA